MVDVFLYSVFEENLIILIQTYLIGLVPFFSQIGVLVWEHLLVIFSFILFWTVDKQLGRIVGMSFIFNGVVTSIIKISVLRKRPYFINSKIKYLQAPKNPSAPIYSVKSQGYSFPSGHTSSGTSVYGSIANYFRNKYITIICMLFIILIGFSRIFLGVHFPSDVLAGVIIGLAIVFFISFLFHRFNSFWPYLILFVCLIPGIFLGSKGVIVKICWFLGFALGFLFEQKFINFEKPEGVLQAILRIIFGIILYVILINVFDMKIFDSDLLKFVSKFLTYFILIAIYPILFDTTKFFS